MASPPVNRLTEMEIRLGQVEERLQNILIWQATVAKATQQILPDISAKSCLIQSSTPPLTPPSPVRDVGLQPVEGVSLAGPLDGLRSVKIVQGSSLHNSNAHGEESDRKEDVRKSETYGILESNQLERHTGVQSIAVTVVKEPPGQDHGLQASSLIAGISASIESSPSAQIASKILDVMASYGQHLNATLIEDDDGASWPAKANFIAQVTKQVENTMPVRMILPSFPWKSINTVDKVNGRLPDLGEVLALSRLNAMCEDIKTVYEVGAKLTIATDGLVFDDIVGISDDDTWAYSQGLADILSEKQFRSIEIARVSEIQGIAPAEINKETYMSLVSRSRAELLEAYGRTEEQIRELIQTDSDSLLTYRGFIRFLEKDLKHSPIGKAALSGSDYRRRVKKVASNMMIRAEAFTKLIQSKRPDHVRLSIHPSTGMVKLSVPLIVTDDTQFPKTPWHCVLALGVDGSYSTVHSQDVRETHTLIHHQGQPYYWRQNSPIWDGFDNQVIMFEPQYPKILYVYPKDSSVELTLGHEQVENLRVLTKIYKGTIKLARFTNAADVFAKSAPAQPLDCCVADGDGSSRMSSSIRSLADSVIDASNGLETAVREKKGAERSLSVLADAFTKIFSAHGDMPSEPKQSA